MLICSQLPAFLDGLPYNFRSKNIQKPAPFAARPLFHFVDTFSARGLGNLLQLQQLHHPVSTWLAEKSPNDSWTFQWEYPRGFNGGFSGNSCLIAEAT